METIAAKDKINVAIHISPKNGIFVESGPYFAE
jgi:hypothetical protein